MSSQASFGSSMLFQAMDDDLNASLATADELSKEFSSLMETASPRNAPEYQPGSVIPREKPQSQSPPITTTITRDKGSSSNGSSSSMPFSPSSTAPSSLDSIISTSKNRPSSPVFTSHQLIPPQVRSGRLSSVPHSGSDSYSYSSVSPNHSPRTQRRDSPTHYNRSPRGSLSYMESSPSPSLTATSSDQLSWPNPHHPSPTLLSPYDAAQMGRRSPRRDRSPSPRPLSHHISNTLPRNFAAIKPIDEGMQRQKSPGKWNETDLDVSYERKPHHTYDKTEWLRPSMPNSNWRESNLDGPPPSSNPKKDTVSRSHHPSYASLPRNTRITVPPDMTSPAHSPFHPQPIISRISIPPASTQARQRKPIPLSVIMRLQSPHWASSQTSHLRAQQEEGDMGMYPQAMPLPREFFTEPMRPPQRPPPELRQPAFYGEVLNPGDIDAELERLNLVHPIPVIHESPSVLERGREAERARAPRPLSPTRLQPMVAPQAQTQETPDLEEVLRIRAEIPRALKRRGSVDQSQPLKRASHYEPNQYKHLINKLFHRKRAGEKGEQESENSSSSEEDGTAATPPPPFPARLTSTPVPHDHRNYHSILRRASRERKDSRRRARLSPLVLLLDGSLVGELDTVQRAVQEMSDPSQPNDEGITALHNAICGGHYAVVDFLVRIGANVSAPDSHGWTPLHCAASCNDRPLCEFLVRNGAAVMAMTESDGAIASQKCDPYAVGYEECASFLRGVEEAMGVENSGVLYALWSYPAQAPDELSFKEGDMVTILQKPEGVDWWWASLCGREGFVPNNYFGLFPKVRPKSLC